MKIIKSIFIKSYIKPILHDLKAPTIWGPRTLIILFFQDHVTSSVNAIKTIKDDKKAGVIESK